MKLSDIRAALAELDLQPSKTLGQNFLHDQNLAAWIVAQLDAGPGDQLIEIGPGLGALTEAALGTGASLTAIEKDARLAERLAERFRAEPRLQVETGDALEHDVRAWRPLAPVKIFGNLPYYISTPLLFHFLSPACPAERAIFLLQRELADRLAAGPGNKDYGVLSIVLGRRWRIRLLRVLPARVFWPEPKVDSALLSFTPRPAAELPACDAPFFERIVRAGFSQRRKQLRKLLPPDAMGALAWPEIVGRLNVPETVRGEELSLEQWIALSNILRPVSAAQAQNSAAERFDVVDEADRVIGAQSRGEVHAKGLRHRAVHLFVFNSRGELFLQKRSPWKDKHPGQWDSSASGHLDSGETYAAAASRELREELGLEGELEEIGALGASEATGWEFIRLYRTVTTDTPRWPASEIEWGGFFPLGVVREWAERRPGDFAPGFLECWQLYIAQSPRDP